MTSDGSHEHFNTNAPIHQRLADVFPDAIILDLNYSIKAVSTRILHLLKFSESDLTDKKISILSDDRAFEDKLRDKFSKGFFQDFQAVLIAGCQRPVLANISGFHLHLVSNATEYIVIKVQSLEELHLAELKLKEKINELDSFLYRAWHDLRGPIATMRGIINLSKIRKDDSEVNLFFDLIAIHAEKLDQELKKLLDHMHPSGKKGGNAGL
jgi:signal transduction histidine kinase